MGVSTLCYLLEYENKKLTGTRNMEIPNLRLDDAIYGKVWDVNLESHWKDFKTLYKLSDEEYNAIRFHYFWCEDLTDVITNSDGEEESVDNFEKVPLDKVVKPAYLRDLLAKIYQIEDKILDDLEKSLQDEFSGDNMKEGGYNEIKLKYRNFGTASYEMRDYILLLGFLIAQLTELAKTEKEVQIIFYGY